MAKPKTGKYWAVDVEGSAELINRLKRFDKDVYKILDREIKKAADTVAEAAREKIPDNGLSNWGRWVERRTSGRTGSSGAISFVQAVTERSLSYDQGAIRKGVKPAIQTRSRKGSAMRWRAIVQQMNPAGAIYMLAGSRNMNAGETLGENLNRKRGGSIWPRALSPALYEKGTEAGDEIAAAIQRAMDQV